MQTKWIGVAVAALLASSAGAIAQGTATVAAEQELRKVKAERVVARERVKLARQQDRVTAAERKVPGATPVTEQEAEQPPRDGPPSAAASTATLEQARTFADFERARDARKAAEQFGGVELGAGFSLTIDLGTKDRIAEAQIVNGVVRVTDQNNALARLLLETHYFFKPQADGPFGLPQDMWGVGPFIAIQPGDERIIEAIGLGLMIGFRREETKTNSFNIGIGLMVDPNTRILGDGFTANQAPPAGETEVRYRETSQKGLMLMTSFTF